MNALNTEAIREKYNRLDEIWDKSDNWFSYQGSYIEKVVEKFIQKTGLVGGELLNAGSAGKDYGLKQFLQTHVDVADEKIRHIPGAICSSVEEIPIHDKQFDIVMCVGSVMAYCTPQKAIPELCRLLKKGGYLIIDFENSRTFEFLGTPDYGSDAKIIKTFCYGEEIQWVFAEKYIKDLIEKEGLTILKKKGFHIISNLVYRITKNSQFSARFAKLDGFFQLIPYFRNHACNYIWLCKKA